MGAHGGEEGEGQMPLPAAGGRTWGSGRKSSTARKALTKPPPAGQTLAFETRNGGVRSSGAGACDWASLFAQLDIA